MTIMELLFPRWMARRVIVRAIRDRAALLFLEERMKLGESDEALAVYAVALGVEWWFDSLRTGD